MPRGEPRVIARARVWGPALLFQQFHVLFDSLSKVLFIFRSLYLCAIGLRPVFSFRWNLPPAWSCIPKQLDSSKGLRAGVDRRPRTGLSPSVTPCSKGLGPATRPEAPSPNYNSGPRGRGPDFKFELLPLHSPLLGQSRLVSCPPLIDMLKFSGYPCPIRGQTVSVGPGRAPGEGGQARRGAVAWRRPGRRMPSGFVGHRAGGRPRPRTLLFGAVLRPRAPPAVSSREGGGGIGPGGRALSPGPAAGGPP